MNTATANEPIQDLDTAGDCQPYRCQLSAVAFRARQHAAGLSREQREAVATRSRFHSMPWLRRQGPAQHADPLVDAVDDELPF